MMTDRLTIFATSGRFGVPASPFGLLGTVLGGAAAYGAVLRLIWPELLVEVKALVRKAVS